MSEARDETAPACEIRVLYVVYWGLLEQLGSALVVPGVQRLSAAGIRYGVVTFEKARDLDHPTAVETTRGRLERAGVTWLPLRYHKYPKWPATFFDVLNGVARTTALGRSLGVRAIHARTYLGGIIGALSARLLRVPYVFHNEGFYPDEQVDGGIWRRDSIPHRIAKGIERRLYANAAGTIVLSERAREEVELFPEVARRGAPVIVVRSCVDLERFPVRAQPPRQPGDPLRLVWLGSVGGRYRFEDAVRLAEIAAADGIPVRLGVLNLVERERLYRTLSGSALPPGSWSVRGVDHSAVGRELVLHDAGLFLFTRGLSEHACSPTKIGEYWAAGLPVVVSPNVSDTEPEVVRRRVGVVVNSHADADFRTAVGELIELLKDPNLGPRCRRAALELYDLDLAAAEQRRLYHRILSG